MIEKEANRERGIKVAKERKNVVPINDKFLIW